MRVQRFLVQHKTVVNRSFLLFPFFRQSYLRTLTLPLPGDTCQILDLTLDFCQQPLHSISSRAFPKLLHRCQLQTHDAEALGCPCVEAINSPFLQLVCTFVVQLLDVAFLQLRLCLGCSEVPPLPNVSDFPDSSSHTSAGSAPC